MGCSDYLVTFTLPTTYKLFLLLIQNLSIVTVLRTFWWRFAVIRGGWLLGNYVDNLKLLLSKSTRLSEERDCDEARENITFSTKFFLHSLWRAAFRVAQYCVDRLLL